MNDGGRYSIQSPFVSNLPPAWSTLPPPITQSRARWVETKRRWPELFAEAVQIDASLRRGLALDKTPYLHARRVPLAQAVALDEAHLGDDGQADGFGNECEGHCGV